MAPLCQGPARRRDLKQQRPPLLHAERLLEVEALGSPLHRLILEHLVMLDEPEMLDRPDRAAEVLARLAALPE